MKKTLIASVLMAAAIFSPTYAAAEYPEKPVNFVVPFPPGDLEDILTRLIADEFQKTYGVPAAVINKPGGGGGPFPGAAEVAGAKADGYTIGSFVIDIPIVGPHVGIPALAPNPFEPVGVFLTYPFVIAASKDQPYSDINGLAAHAKKNEVALGHFGSFLVPTQVTFALAKTMKFDFDSETAFDTLDCNTLASGDVDVINTSLQLILPCMDKVNVLASIGDKRIPLTPNTPTVAELQPSLAVSLWNGIFVHKDTPANVRAKIEAVAKKAMLSAKAQKIAAETGALIYWRNAADSTTQIGKDMETLGRIEALITKK